MSIPACQRLTTRALRTAPGGIQGGWPAIDERGAPWYTEPVDFRAAGAQKGMLCVGKFSVHRTATGFKFDLRAANGQIIATSGVYDTEAACRRGVESVRKNAPAAGLADRTAGEGNGVLNPKFELYVDKAGHYRFRLKARNGQIIAASEGYSTRAACLNGIDSVRANASGAKAVWEE